jgi:hypothetical protein
MKAFCLKAPGVIGYCDVPEPEITLWGAIIKPIVVTPLLI